MSLTTDHSRATLVGDHSHGPADGPQASRAARTRSFEVADFPVPEGSEEEWRFTPLDVLAPVRHGEVGRVPRDDPRGKVMCRSREIDLALLNRCRHQPTAPSI